MKREAKKFLLTLYGLAKNKSSPSEFFFGHYKLTPSRELVIYVLSELA